MPMTKKRIVLIETKSTHIHVYSFAPIPRLGAVLLGTILRNRGYHVDVFIEDMGAVDMDIVRQADLVGISLITATAPRSYQMAATIRALGIPVVLGGPHVSFVPDEAIEHADYCLCGEADETMPLFVDTLFEQGDLTTVPGLLFHQGEQVIVNTPAKRPEDLDRNPFADFSLVRAERHYPIASISTSRGCPFDCSFCSVTTFNGRGFRTHSVEHTLDEIEYQFKHNYFRAIFFADDIFNANKRRMAELAEGMIRRKLTPAWGAQMRHEVTRDEEVVALLKRANCQRAFVGFESINPAALKAYNKKETVDDIIRTVQVFHRHGIAVHGMFVVGCDEDTVQTVRETVRFCIEHKVDTVQFMVLTPLPGSRDYQQYARNERPLLSRRWDLYDGHHVLFEPRNMTSYELQIESMRAMRRFYSLGRVVGSFLRGEMTNAVIRAIGWRTVRAWHKQADNIEWVGHLRERLWEGARQLAGGRVPVGRPATVAVLPPLPDLHLRQAFEQFLSNLGARVEQVTEDWASRLTQQKQRVAETADNARQHAIEWLRNLRGRVRFVVAPPQLNLEECRTRLAEEMEHLRERVRARFDDLPQVLRIPENWSEDLAEVREWLFKVGLIFTEDLALIRSARALFLEQIKSYRESQQPAQA